jgi:hypothetical protein
MTQIARAISTKLGSLLRILLAHFHFSVSSKAYSNFLRVLLEGAEFDRVLGMLNRFPNCGPGLVIV